MPGTIAVQLGNFFINSRGEVCRDLQSSKSRVADQIRRKRAVEAASQMTSNLQKQIKLHVQKCEQLRKQGVALKEDDPNRATTFKQAAWHAAKSKALRAKIIEINTQAREG